MNEEIIRKEDRMIKRIFMKACSVAVILFFFFPVLKHTWKKASNLFYLYYDKAINYLLSFVEQNIFYGVAILILIIIIILWILSDSNENEISKEEASEENILKEV